MEIYKDIKFAFVMTFYLPNLVIFWHEKLKCHISVDIIQCNVKLNLFTFSDMKSKIVI